MFVFSGFKAKRKRETKWNRARKSLFSMNQSPSMAAGRIFNMRQSIRAIFNVGSERPAI